jgi:hypothetical protein
VEFISAAAWRLAALVVQAVLEVLAAEVVVEDSVDSAAVVVVLAAAAQAEAGKVPSF